MNKRTFTLLFVSNFIIIRRTFIFNFLVVDACDVTLSVYPHRASLKNMPDTVGIEPTTFGILAHF